MVLKDCCGWVEIGEWRWGILYPVRYSVWVLRHEWAEVKRGGLVLVGVVAGLDLVVM